MTNNLTTIMKYSDDTTSLIASPKEAKAKRIQPDPKYKPRSLATLSNEDLPVAKNKAPETAIVISPSKVRSKVIPMNEESGNDPLLYWTTNKELRAMNLIGTKIYAITIQINPINTEIPTTIF